MKVWRCPKCGRQREWLNQFTGKFHPSASNNKRCYGNPVLIEEAKR